MKSKKTFSRVLDRLILASILLFFASAGFQDKSISGWYRQYITNLNGSTIKDMTFLDSLTGFAVTNSNSLLQEYILKTTNGGDNWFINYIFTTPNSNYSFVKIGFIDSNTGFAFSWTEMFKTTNKGVNWNMIVTGLYPDDIAILNQDTMLAVKYNSFNGGVYRTINGGYNWQNIWNIGGGSGNPKKIYMYDKNMGFSCVDFQTPRLRKTTNGGFNWFDINDNDFYDIKFIDSLTGWKVNGTSVKKTTDGGISWFSQMTPNLYSNLSQSLSILNKDTIWSAGSNILINSQIYGTLLKTTNGGLNWGYQIPDTSFAITRYRYIKFINDKIGWAYNPSLNIGIHTTIGGNDTTYYTAINNDTKTVPEDFVLYQNYPNPFNPVTNIKYKILKSSYISIDVTDMLGRNIITLISKKHSPGNYEVKFNGENISSGLYFYTLKTDDKIIQTRKMLLVK